MSNQEHRISRLAARAGAASVTLQDGKFDREKVLNPGTEGTENRHEGVYRSHLREYVAEQWKHHCAYCRKPDWKDRRRFELDHVVPRSRKGSTNAGNIVWCCHACNRAKKDSKLETFLKENPGHSTAVRTRKDLPPPLAASGAIARTCETLRGRLKARGLDIRTTTEADTGQHRRELQLTKNQANNAACCGSSGQITQLRRPTVLKAVGHGHRKQIKSPPVGTYLAWRHQPPAERRKSPCPGHAPGRDVVWGVRSGDLVQIRSGTSWVKGRAQVEGTRQRVSVTAGQQSISAGQSDNVRLMATRNGYREPSGNGTRPETGQSRAEARNSPGGKKGRKKRRPSGKKRQRPAGPCASCGTVTNELIPHQETRDGVVVAEKVCGDCYFRALKTAIADGDVEWARLNNEGHKVPGTTNARRDEEGGPGWRADKATERQLKFVKSLAWKRNYKIKDSHSLTKGEASDLIDKLKARPVPQTCVNCDERLMAPAGRARKYCKRCSRLTPAQRRKMIGKPSETIPETPKTGEEPGADAEGGTQGPLQPSQRKVARDMVFIRVTQDSHPRLLNLDNVQEFAPSERADQSGRLKVMFSNGERASYDDRFESIEARLVIVEPSHSTANGRTTC